MPSMTSKARPPRPLKKPVKCDPAAVEQGAVGSGKTLLRLPMPGYDHRLPITVVEIRARKATTQVVVSLDGGPLAAQICQEPGSRVGVRLRPGTTRQSSVPAQVRRSEERRVGKE